LNNLIHHVVPPPNNILTVTATKASTIVVSPPTSTVPPPTVQRIILIAPPVLLPVPPNRPLIDVARSIYFVFDIETPGFSKERNFIIEIASVAIDPHGNKVHGSTFSALIRPPTRIPDCIMELTGITNMMVDNKRSFLIVGDEFLQYIMSATDVHYDLSCKVKELLELLEERYDRLFVAGKNLSLDETGIHAFSWIKFKIQIIMKSARYSIKLYVITDAETAFVLCTIIYTGTHTYYEKDNNSLKKTVAVIKRLCTPFEGSHRTVFVDLFYTSLDLLKELDTMNFYVTGTVMRNRLPKELKNAKACREFKIMKPGDHKMHKYSYTTADGNVKDYVLVCWKDRDIVYCLTYVFTTITTE
jgi:Transposase IS4